MGFLWHGSGFESGIQSCLSMKIKDIRNFLRKTFRFGSFIPLSNILPLYLGRVMPERFKDWMSSVRNKRIKAVISNNVDCRTSKQYCMEESGNAPIWYFWLQGEDKLPLIPKLCLASIRKYSSGHDVIFLDSENFQDYVKMPDYIMDLYSHGILKAAHFADIMRVTLLFQRGGLWLDSTVLLTSPIPEDVFARPFFSIKTKPFGRFVSQCRWSVFCLGGHKGNPIFGEVSRMFFEYLSKETVFVDYFMFDQFIDILYENNPQIREMIDDVPMNNPDVHALAPILCDKTDMSSLAGLGSETFIFKLNWKKFTDIQLLASNDSLFAHLFNVFKE